MLTPEVLKKVIPFHRSISAAALSVLLPRLQRIIKIVLLLEIA